MGKMCLGKDVVEISSDRNEGSGDWDSPKYKDTARSGGKKEPEALVFRKMYTKEDSDRYITQCFVNGLYASDGEINLEKNENLILNDYAVKLCFEYERALAHNIDVRYEILEEVRPVIETLAYSDKYRKLLDEILADKVRLDGMIKLEEERVMVKVKGQMFKEK
ncbi:hypothetical protein Tco_0107838, partial [Tanacetum coccineum]